ncbi:MAG: hypothetical protein GX592_12275, partial [Clostridiales bacterium]|nr:hypothetical protein [Clostridiales bacterium]
MRKWFVLALLTVLVLSCAARAESVTDALGITGEGGVSAKGDFSARTEADLFVVMNDGEKKSLVRVPRSGGEPALVESADAISDLVAIGNDLYYLRTGGGVTAIVRRHADSSRSEVCAFKEGQVAHALSAFAENLYVIVDDEVHVVYPANGLTLKLVAVKMGDYAIAGDYLYYISLTDALTYESPSLLGADTISRSAGCLYRVNLKTGNSSLLIKTGVEGLECLDGALFFHNLSDHYVMGGDGKEWLEGRLYRFDLRTERLAKIVEGYDWGYYPMADGVAVYTSENLSLYSDEGALIRSLYAPEAYAVISGDAEVLVVYEPTPAKVSYVYPDGTVLDAYKGEPGATPPEPAATASPFATEFPPLEEPTATEPAGDTGDDFTPATSNWLEGNTETPPAGSASGGSTSGGSAPSGSTSGGVSFGEADDAGAEDASTGGKSSGGSYTTSSYGSGKTLTATASVNLRKGPGTGYAIITAVAKGKTA